MRVINKYYSDGFRHNNADLEEVTGYVPPMLLLFDAPKFLLNVQQKL